MIAANPTGMLIQKIDRHPAVETRNPPTMGPSAMEMPTTAPQTPTACARSRGIGEGVRDDGHGNRVEHGPPDRLEHAEHNEETQAGSQAAEQRPGSEDREADDERAPPSKPISRRARQHQEAGQDEGVGIHHPLQARDRCMQLAPDGREGDVHDGHIESDDEQAHGADEQDPDSPVAAQLVDGHSSAGWRGAARPVCCVCITITTVAVLPPTSRGP